MIKKKKKLDVEIMKMVSRAIEIAGTKLILSRHLGVEWTTVDRWKEGLFKPSIENYVKLKNLVDRGTMPDGRRR